jgi:succinoglycan biosynthesis transport protein ExoP
VADAPRYRTLQDYVRVVRDHRLLVVLFMVLCTAAGVAISNRQHQVYQATASLIFHDDNADLADVGLAAPVTQTPDQRAAVGADRVTQVAVAVRARQLAHLTNAPGELLSHISAQPEARTNLVDVIARWSSAAGAADLANAFARATLNIQTVRARANYRRRARVLAVAVASLPKGGAGGYARSVNADRIARLQSLGEFATPVELAIRARPPSAAISPKPVRNALLGLLAGITLGLLAAFIRDALDRRVRTTRDLYSAVDLPVLGQLDRSLIRRAVAADRAQRPLSGEDVEPFRIVRRNLVYLAGATPPQVVLVTSAGAGEGKTTVAVGLAGAEARAGRRVILVECDLRRPTLAKRLKLRPGPGLTDVVTGHASRDAAVATVPVRADGARGGREEDGAFASTPAIAVLPAGAPSPSPGELLGSLETQALLAELRDSYDVVILDATPLLGVVDARELIPLTDATVLCVRAASTTRDDLRAAKAALDMPAHPVGIVLTGAREDAEPGYAPTSQPAVPA